MSPQELLSSQRTVYVLAEKPGIDDTTAKPYWSLKLEGLHPDQLKSAVARLRTHPQFQHSRLIVITSLDANERCRYAFALEGLPVVHKPQLVQELPALLRAMLA